MQMVSPLWGCKRNKANQATSIKQLIYRKLEFLKTKKWLVWIDIAMKHFTKKDYKYSVLM